MGLVTQIEQNRNELGTEKERLQKEGKFFLSFFLLKKQSNPIIHNFLQAYYYYRSTLLTLGTKWRNHLDCSLVWVWRFKKRTWKVYGKSQVLTILVSPPPPSTRGSLVLPILRGLLSPCWPSRLYALTVQWSLNAFLFFFLSSRYILVLLPKKCNVISLPDAKSS